MDDLTLYSAKEIEEICGSLWTMADSKIFLCHNLAEKTDIGEELTSLYSACRDLVSSIEYCAEQTGLKL